MQACAMVTTLRTLFFVRTPAADKVLTVALHEVAKPCSPAAANRCRSPTNALHTS